MIKHLWAAALTASLLAGTAAPVAAAPRKAAKAALSPDARAAALVAKMTREEKLILVYGYFSTDFPSKAVTGF